MNLRQKFFWNILVIIALITTAFSGYNLFQFNEERTRLWNNYLTEEIGTDDELQEMVLNLESEISIRKQFIFKMKNNPLDITNVLILGDDFKNFKSSKKLRVSAYIKNPFTDEEFIMVNYKNHNYILAEGDSVAGGIIKSIDLDGILFEKDGDLKKLSLPN